MSQLAPPSRARLFASFALVLSLPLGTAITLPAADEDLADRARRGKEAMAAGRFAEAAALYEPIVKALPDEPGMRLNLGMALAMAGRPGEAVPHLQAALRLRPDLLPADLFLGSAFTELGRPKDAVGPLRAFVAAVPDHREARQMLADALLALESYAEAAREYAVLVKGDVPDPKAWYGLGRSYQGLSQEAFVALQRGSPDSPYVSILVAESLVAQQRDKSAFALYREVLEKDPVLAEAHEALAGIYERSGHADWAAKERERARQAPAPDCRTRSLQCDFLARRFDAVIAAAASLRTPEAHYWTFRAADERAREAFARLGSLPPSPEAVLVRVEILRSQRRYLESKEALEKATSTWPADRRIRRELATLHFIAHEQTEARPLLEDLLKHEPGSADLNLLLGASWLESKQPAKAVPYLEAAVRLDPELARARAVLGRAYLEAGQAARAVPLLKGALADDDDGSFHFQLARAYRETGQADQARRVLAEFQQIQQRNEAEEAKEKAEFSITPP